MKQVIRMISLVLLFHFGMRLTNLLMDNPSFGYTLNLYLREFMIMLVVHIAVEFFINLISLFMEQK